jgi:hypothetical protein
VKVQGLANLVKGEQIVAAPGKLRQYVLYESTTPGRAKYVEGSWP